MSQKTHTAGVWLALIAAFSFSMKAIFVKLAYQWPVDAVTLLALRMLFSLPFFAVVGLRESRGVAPLTARQWAAVLLLGLLGYYGASILDFIGLQYISAGLERLILFSYPTLTLLLGVALFGHRIGRRELVALALCYAGIAAAFAHDLNLSADVDAIWIGAGFVFASSICYAGYLAGSGRYIPILGASRFAGLAVLVSIIVAAVSATVSIIVAAVFATAFVSWWSCCTLVNWWSCCTLVNWWSCCTLVNWWWL